MKIDVAEVLKKVGDKLKVEESFAVSFPKDNLILTAPLKVKLNLISTGRTILLKGKASTAVELECCRCLKRFNAPLTFEIEEEYSRNVRKIKRGAAKEIELEEADFIFPIAADNTIDLTEAMRQNILTNLPIKALCRNDCPGLENKAGAGKKVDPRLQKLKEFM